MVALGILALVASLIYGAFRGMQRSREGLSQAGERYHQGRSALSRMSREVSAAFVSTHLPLVASQASSMTAFIGKDSNPDRLDFASFSHRRYGRDTHESDQSEIGYFASTDPDARDKIDLARREAKVIDLDPERGGVVAVLAEDLERFDLEYLDPLTGQWLTSWDTTQGAGQPGRLPSQVKIRLELRGLGPGAPPIPFVTRVALPIQAALAFALPRPTP